MMVDGTPHIAIREAVDVHVEVAVGIHVDVRDEKLITDLEQEKGGAPVLTEPIPGFHEVNNLTLRPAKAIQGTFQAPKDFRKCPVLCNFVDNRLRTCLQSFGILRT